MPASTGFDPCSHALECWTAKSHSAHAPVPDPARRQCLQGSNPFSDVAAREAMRLVDAYLVRGVGDAVEADVAALAASSSRQARAIANAPRESNAADLENMYRGALAYR